MSVHLTDTERAQGWFRRAVRGVFVDVAPNGKAYDCVRDTDFMPTALSLGLRNWDRCPYGIPGMTFRDRDGRRFIVTGNRVVHDDGRWYWVVSFE